MSKTILHYAETLQGGVGTVMRLLAEGQSARDHAVWVAGPAKHLDAMGWQPPLGVAFAREGRGVGDILRGWAALAKLWWRLRPDVVMLHSTFAGLEGRVLAPLMTLGGRRARVIYMPHAFAFMMAGSRLSAAIYRVVERLLLPLTGVVVCVSEDERQAGLRTGLLPAKLTVVHNGVPAPLPVAGSDPFAEAGVAAGDLKMLFVGRFDAQKGFDRLALLMEALHDAPVHLLAVGAPVRGDAMPPLPPRTTFAGWVKPGDIERYFAHADVLLMPSRWEGFAMVPLEAMSHGKAIVASHAGSLPEAVADGETGFCVDFDDTDAVATLLRTLPRARWAAMGKAGKARWAARFSAAKMVEGVEALL